VTEQALELASISLQCPTTLVTLGTIAVQKRLGHCSVSARLKVFAYLLRDDSSVADAMDGLLKPPTE
jgi:hypothetical protein